jgi:hypothetical protein
MTTQSLPADIAGFLSIVVDILLAAEHLNPCDYFMRNHGEKVGISLRRASLSRAYEIQLSRALPLVHPPACISQ